MRLCIEVLESPDTKKKAKSRVRRPKIYICIWNSQSVPIYIPDSTPNHQAPKRSSGLTSQQREPKHKPVCQLTLSDNLNLHLLLTHWISPGSEENFWVDLTAKRVQAQACLSTYPYPAVHWISPGSEEKFWVHHTAKRVEEVQAYQARVKSLPSTMGSSQNHQVMLKRNV